MRLAMIGLGRMGANMVRRLVKGGHEVVVWDRDRAAVDALAEECAIAGSGLDDVRERLGSPAVWWLMLPAGEVTETIVDAIAERAEAGDVIIDGGNGFYKDDIRRAGKLAERGIDYVDVGTSGGVWGRDRGYCMMIGGREETLTYLDPVFETLAPGMGDIPRTPYERPAGDDWRAERGFIHAGPAGAGHFVKMVRNGIEYGLMQAYAEGFDVLKGRNGAHVPEEERFDLNLTDVAEVWRRGSVISSWLLDLTSAALAEDCGLERFGGNVADSGEGQWTIDAAMEEKVPADVLAASLFARYRSRVDHTFGDRVLSAMRFGFGGHVEMPQ